MSDIRSCVQLPGETCPGLAALPTYSPRQMTGLAFFASALSEVLGLFHQEAALLLVLLYAAPGDFHDADVEYRAGIVFLRGLFIPVVSGAVVGWHQGASCVDFAQIVRCCRITCGGLLLKSFKIGGRGFLRFRAGGKRQGGRQHKRCCHGGFLNMLHCCLMRSQTMTPARAMTRSTSMARTMFSTRSFMFARVSLEARLRIETAWVGVEAWRVAARSVRT